MSTFSSYENQFLDKKIVNLNEELIKLKTPQRYGMKDIQVFESNTVNVSSHTFPMTSPGGQYSFTGSATNILRLRFTGNKPDKTVIGWLNVAITVKSGPAYDYGLIPYFKQYRGSKPNELEFLTVLYGGNDFLGHSYTVFDGALTVLSNEQGELSIIETYDIGQYYRWMFG